MSRSLGLDIGNRRIGVATSDTLKMIARPLMVIDRKRQDAIGAIAACVESQQADELVVGYPLQIDGIRGAQAQAVERFVSALGKRVNLPVVYCDERYSTSDARELMMTIRRKGSDEPDDAIAAAVILQRMFDQRREARHDKGTEIDNDLLDVNE
ncbi:MAG TPA: Holliday junction resolvase RuvX [Anaerolineae bacterium]